MDSNKKLTKEEKAIIKEALIRNSRKVKLFINIINTIPDNSVWALQEFNNEIWSHYSDWNKIKPYLIISDITFDYIYPDIYVLLNKESKKILTDILMENPNSIECYFWHNIFFKDDIIYAEIIEGSVSMYIRKELNIDISGNEDWADFL